MEYDVIGDIHGQADKLDALLGKLGYARRGALWVPPQGKQALFLGDLIDRGPAQLRVLNTVRSMVDAGYARCVMGNHELNAIGFATPRLDRPAEYLRKRTPDKVAQHAEFLRQVGAGSALHAEWVQWFRTLPPYLNLGGIRAVHAWWNAGFVDLLSQAPEGFRSDEFLYRAFDDRKPERKAIKGLTNGLEIRLPPGCSFFDKNDVERFDVRTKWWLPSASTYRDVAILDEGQRMAIPDQPLPASFELSPLEGPPVFVGHYWMTGTPTLQSPKLACLDYSAAKSGPLVAYRWEGEDVLSSTQFVATD